MLWQLIWPALGGLLIGSLGRLAVPGPDAPPWPRTPAVGLLGGLVGGVLASIVIGREHRVIGYAVAALVAALFVGGYSVARRSRALAVQSRRN